MKTAKTLQVQSALQAVKSFIGSSSAAPASRRGLLAGVGIAAVATVAVKVLPGAAPVVAAVSPAAVAHKVLDTSGGYQLTPHVRRYYETTQA